MSAVSGSCCAALLGGLVWLHLRIQVTVKTPALNIDMSSEGFHVLLNLSCLNMAPISRKPSPRRTRPPQWLARDRAAHAT